MKNVYIIKEDYMPILDLSVKEMETYLGTNAKPKDFESFWDKGLEEIKLIDQQVKLIKSTFQVPFATCYHLYFTGTKGARIHSKLVVPKKAKGSAVIKFHGYSVDSGEWTDLLAYAAVGHVVAALDCRGQGGLSEDVGGVIGGTLYGFIVKGLDSGPSELYYRQVFLDTALLTQIIMAREDVDASRVGVFGGSQGGGLTLACAALTPSIKKVSPVFPFLSDYKRVWEMDLDMAAYVGLRDYFRKFDPTHEREEEIFERLGYIDIQHLANRIRGEVLFATGLIDPICPPSTQYATYNKITSKKTHILYPDFKHEDLKGFKDQQFQFFLDL